MADACKMVMGNSKAIERLAKEKPGLAKRIADWLHEFFSDIRKAFEGVEAQHEEAKAMLDYMDELTKLWDDALVEAAENRGGTKKGSSIEAKQSQRDYSYESLIKKSPIKIVDVPLQTVPTKGKKVDQVSMLGYARHGAGTIKNGAITQKYIYNPDLNRNILITRDGIVHGITGHTTNGSTMNTAEVTYSLPEILRNSVVVNEFIPRESDNAIASYVLFGYARRADGQEYIVRSTVYEREDNLSTVESVEIFDVLKGIKAKKIDSSTQVRNTVPPLKIKESTKNISDILDYVKDYYPNYLPRSVADHYGMSDYTREPGLKYSDRDSAEGLTKEEARAQAAAYTRLKAENAELRRRVEYWKGQTQRTKQASVRQTDVNRFARQLIKRYGSTTQNSQRNQSVGCFV